MVQMFSLINILNCLPPLTFVPEHICMRLTILTGSKNNHKTKVGETLQWPVGSRHAPHTVLSFPKMLIALTTTYMGREEEGASAIKKGLRVKRASYYH